MPDLLWQLEGVQLGRRLRDVSVSISAGVTAVLGHSGAGKTSLLNLLVGFERPDAGTLRSAVAAGAHRRPLFWVPQDDGLWPHLTARQHLLEVGAHQAEELLAAFDLKACAGALPATLSQGERARVAVARALAAEAAALLMDEPLAHVEPGRAAGYWEVIRRHLDATRSSLVFATHASGVVMAEAQRVLCLRDGQMVYAGAVADLYWRPPSAELALCLGEVNWLDVAEQRLWLAAPAAAALCLRPEQLAVVPAADGPLHVETSRFQGAVAEVQLRHPASGCVRRFWHRPVSNHLPHGARVRLEVRCR